VKEKLNEVLKTIKNLSLDALVLEAMDGMLYAFLTGRLCLYSRLWGAAWCSLQSGLQNTKCTDQSPLTEIIFPQLAMKLLPSVEPNSLSEYYKELSVSCAK